MPCVGLVCGDVERHGRARRVCGRLICVEGPSTGTTLSPLRQFTALSEHAGWTTMQGCARRTKCNSERRSCPALRLLHVSAEPCLLTTQLSLPSSATAIQKTAPWHRTARPSRGMMAASGTPPYLRRPRALQSLPARPAGRSGILPDLASTRAAAGMQPGALLCPASTRRMPSPSRTSMLSR